MMAVDLDGVFLCTKHAGAGDGGGAAAARSSTSPRSRRSAARRRPAHYGAAKAGVVSLTKTAALELRDHGVRVNAICPGWVDTDMVNDHKGEARGRCWGSRSTSTSTTSRAGSASPTRSPALAVFLASDRSRFSVGAAYNVDGGATASLV